MIISIDNQIDSVKREIKRRKKIFPSLVERGKLTESDSLVEITLMQGVLETLTVLKGIVR